MGEVSLETLMKKEYDSRHDKLKKQYEYNWIDNHKHIQENFSWQENIFYFKKIVAILRPFS